jgi:hypothetical protein
MSVSVKKSTAERYYFHSKDPYWWADICVTPDGSLTIRSDYGDYSYGWNAFGENFKKFLISIDKGYLTTKIGGYERYKFDSEKTSKALKKDIIKARLEKRINAEQARDFFEIAFEVESSNEFEYFSTMQNSGYDLVDVLYWNDMSCVPCEKSLDCQLVAFAEIIWPEFIKELEKEINYQKELDETLNTLNNLKIKL